MKNIKNVKKQKAWYYFPPRNNINYRHGSLTMRKENPFNGIYCNGKGRCLDNEDYHKELYIVKIFYCPTDKLWKGIDEQGNIWVNAVPDKWLVEVED